MKTKHTKGKWVIENRKHGFYICAGIKGFVIADITSDEITHFIGNTDEAEANARLIATAPELLEALNDLVEKVSPYIFKLGAKKAFDELLSIEQAKKAIRKATE